MKKMKHGILILGLLLGIGTFAFSATTPAGAINVFGNGCSGQAKDAKSVCGNTGNSAASMAKTVINVMLFILGIISVIMIVIGGMRYVVSNGDSSTVTAAKNTILYSVVGLVVAIMAYAIVNFVITSFK